MRKKKRTSPAVWDLRSAVMRKETKELAETMGGSSKDNRKDYSGYRKKRWE